MTVKLAYPEELPVSAHRTEIIAALRKNPVIIVCGDTGSGKTTQLPKMVLEAWHSAPGARGRIVCTQPRRLAAVTMAERVAGELNTEVGALVGYHHRYARKTSESTRITFMTDGVLLAETRNDRLLRRYDCIIVDEAHERSLNVDFLLGILARILERRRDLKVIVSSATLDAGRFSEFFGGAPVISVPGRLYPIETRYMPCDEDERDLARDVVSAVRILPREGDVLVFLPGERDIRESAAALSAEFPRDEIIPLLASLPGNEQRRAFQLSHNRRIVLATNVAETSVTIPGIRAVVDSGLVRLSRYSHRTQVQRLQIEPISQASARQRQGRCGRIGPGICIRLYSEEDYLSREEYTPPEILRSSLAGVILTMLDLGLGDISRFPFLEPPRPGMITEGFRELIELGAISRDEGGNPCLTKIGRALARIPVEPRLARMLIESSRLATLPSALPVVAAMSCEDPRRRPADERDKAKQAHAQFKVANSDFLGRLKMWNWWRKQNEELSQTKLRKLCKETYLSYPKMREWGELVRQLSRLTERLGLDVKNDNGGPDALHRSLLTGLLGRLGKFFPEERNYRGARGLKFIIHPGSALAKGLGRNRAFPEWIMAGELIDTSQLYASEVTAIDPAWVEQVAGTLAKHHVHSPEWDGRSGFVRGTEQVTLYGLVIVPARRCDYSRYDPKVARDVFIRRGLVDGECPHPPPIIRRNTALLDALRSQADKMRRLEVFDEDALARHFDEAMPKDITNAPALVRWLRQATQAELAGFELKKSEWWPSEHIGERDYPDTIKVGDTTLRLIYRNNRDDPETDGITCRVRKSQANALRHWHWDWLVSGMLPEKVFWMLSVQPSALRRALTPLADYVTRMLPLLKPGNETLEDAVVRLAYEEWGFRLSREAWQRAKLPNHLKVRFEIVDDKDGRVLAANRDLDAALSTAGVIEVVRDPVEEKRQEYFTTLGEKAKMPIKERDLTIAAQCYLKDVNYDLQKMAGDVLAGTIRAMPVDELDKRATELRRVQCELTQLSIASLNGVARLLNVVETDQSIPADTAEAVQTQLVWLAPPGFPRSTPLDKMRRMAVYLKGIEVRLQRAKLNHAGDRAKELRFAPYWQRYRAALKDTSRNKPSRETLERFRWLLEEFRISLFAQELKTAEPVSEKRLDALLKGKL